MPHEPYYSTGPDASGDGFAVSMDALTVALARRKTSGEWELSSTAPLAFRTVSLGDLDEEQARRRAVAWVEHHVATERRDLLAD
jgi:hypothetical protein